MQSPIRQVKSFSFTAERMSEKLWYLKRCNLFEQLTPDQISRLESRCRTRKFTRNEPVYLPADEASSVLLLVSGRVKICNITSEGKQAILAFIEPGELFGELAMLETGQREEYAEATENSTVVLIPGDEIQRLMQEHADVAIGITKLMGFRRKKIERRLKYLLFHSNRDRLIHLLLELSEQYGKQTADGLMLDFKLSHQDLANIIGSTRETVTVALGEMQSEGLLVLGRRKVVLKDVERLAQSIEMPAPQLKEGRPHRDEGFQDFK